MDASRPTLRDCEAWIRSVVSGGAVNRQVPWRRRATQAIAAPVDSLLELEIAIETRIAESDQVRDVSAAADP
jgi:hypothetical protein